VASFWSLSLCKSAPSRLWFPLPSGLQEWPEPRNGGDPEVLLDVTVVRYLRLGASATSGAGGDCPATITRVV
jgi:hypothetical protein